MTHLVVAGAALAGVAVAGAGAGVAVAVHRSATSSTRKKIRQLPRSYQNAWRR